MRKNRSVKQRVKRKPINEWLNVVESFEKLMEERASTETPDSKHTLLDKETIDAVNRAYSGTLHYYTALLGGREHDTKVEKLIPRLWQQAGTRMRRYDAALAKKLKADNRFWACEVTWRNETIQQVWPHLNAIRVCANRMDPTLRNRFSVS